MQCIDAGNANDDVGPGRAVAMMLAEIYQHAATRDAHEEGRIVVKAMFEFYFEPQVVEIKLAAFATSNIRKIGIVRSKTISCSDTTCFP